MSEKVGFTKTLESYRERAGLGELVAVPDLHYLAIDGHRDANSPAFGEAMGALFPVAYALELASKAAGAAAVQCQRARSRAGRCAATTTRALARR